MEFNNPQARSYLMELYSLTGTDLEQVVSMYEVGELLGLEKSEAGTLAEDLIVEGVVELRSLAGGISITAEGLSAIDVQGPKLPESVMKFSGGLILDEEDRTTVETLLREIKDELSSEQYSFEHLEEIVLDIKTMHVQLLSPSPKTAIVREIFTSIAASLSRNRSSELGEKISGLIKV